MSSIFTPELTAALVAHNRLYDVKEFAKAADALLAEGLALLRAHAGDGDVINRYVATVETVRAQYRAAKEAPAAGIYTGPVLTGMRFEYKDSVFVPDGRRGSMGEFLNAQGDGLSEPNLRGMYRPIPDPASDVAPPGFRIVGRSGPGVAQPAGDTWVRFGRWSDGTAAGGEGDPFDPPMQAENVTDAQWNAGCYDILEPIPDPAPEPSGNTGELPTAPPAGVPACDSKCGGKECWGGCFGRHGNAHLCSEACVASGRSLNPPPSAPVTVATGGDECPGCDDHCEDEKCPAAHGPCVDEPVATGGVPAGFRLGDGWSFRQNGDFWCSHNERTCSGVGPFKHYETHKGACAAHAVTMGALVPINTARPGPAHPATGTTCTRCGQVIQSVLSAFPPVATVDGWRHERCPEVPPGPVPVEAGRTGGHTNECATWNPGRARCDCQPVAPPAAPASEPAVTCSVPCLSRTCSRTCELDHGHPPDRDHSHASRSNEAGHTWPASEPAVRPLSVPQEAIDREVAECRAMERKFPVSRPDSTAVVVALADRLDAARAEIGQLHERAEKAEALRNQAIAYLETEMNNHRATAAEVEQLRGKLAEEREDGRAERVMLLERLDQATARVRSMRETAAKVVDGGGWICGYECGHDKCVETRRLARAIRSLPLDTGTATDASGEVTKWALQVAEAWLHRSWSGADMAGGSIADLAATITDAIKAAVAPHVCKCSNGPCPKCGGTGPEGEWFEGSEVECADCGAPLIVATAEPCHGSSTFEAIDEEPDEEDDESGEDAPGAVGK